MGEPVPVDCLFRENSYVFKAGWLEKKREVFVWYCPWGRWWLSIVPASACGLCSLVCCVCLVPQLFGLGFFPENSGIGPDDRIVVKSFELFSFAAVEKFVGFPVCWIKNGNG